MVQQNAGARRTTIDPFAGKTSPPVTSQSLRDRLGALRNLVPFLKQIWATSPGLTLAGMTLRIIRALLPSMREAELA